MIEQKNDKINNNNDTRWSFWIIFYKFCTYKLLEEHSLDNVKQSLSFAIHKIINEIRWEMYKGEKRIYNGNIQDAFKTINLNLKFTLIKSA